MMSSRGNPNPQIKQQLRLEATPLGAVKFKKTFIVVLLL